MDVETQYTTNSSKPPAIVIGVEIPTKTIALLAVAVFVALLGALLIYKNS